MDTSPDPKKKSPVTDPRKDLAAVFYTAFDYYNEWLFKSLLSRPVITTQRKKNAAGFFKPEEYYPRGKEHAETPVVLRKPHHTIAMMPEAMADETDEEVLSTLVHEMCHLWQHDFGTPSRAGYHNEEWSQKMKEVGLRPSSLGKYDARNPALSEEQRQQSKQGRETGQRMSHYIDPAGAFAEVTKKLLATGWEVTFQAWLDTTVKPKKKRESKVCYQCPECRAKAWGKPKSNLVCGRCDKKMTPRTAKDRLKDNDNDD